MTDLLKMGQLAKACKYYMNSLSTDAKNKALIKIADDICVAKETIIAANNVDIENGINKGMHEGLIDRLRLTPERIEGIVEGIRQVAALDDPVGRILEERSLYNDLRLSKVSVPLGVIGIIYESRPNVTADAFALCFKAGNAVILKGGSDALNSNLAITNVIRESLNKQGLDKNCIQLIDSTDRNVTTEFMKLKEYVDVLIPRGSAGLIKSVVENSSIPVIETGSGNCHIFVDESADLDMATEIIFNAKTQRIGVCNACESLVVHKNIVMDLLPALKKKLDEKNVVLKVDDLAKTVLTDCESATSEDFAKEYLDYILSIKTVDNLDEAIAHINNYSTHHSEAIITNDKKNADIFLRDIDSACVYVNASTRFTDGFEFGLGAEIGISTQRLHARGPMGLNELTTYKYNIIGKGQVRG
ncbi:MAG: glutamate-5-semialdehyde dehydrogenase [Lachnospiraceae bacterium]|nr:glutamate-5-semialdehyde dehydrogenase [Candidatus Colinaster equi]